MVGCQANCDARPTLLDEAIGHRQTAPRGLAPASHPEHAQEEESEPRHARARAASATHRAGRVTLGNPPHV